MNRPLSPAVVLFIANGVMASGALLAQPAAKIEFEVATMKPSPPPDGRGSMVGCRGGPKSKDPIQFTCQNMSLANYVQMAFGMPYFQISTPDWMMNTRFDLRAKVPDGATKEQTNLMLRSLLEDRFKLVVHHETRDIAKYDLLVAKNGPKLKPAVEPPAQEGSATNEPPPMPLKRDKDGYPILGPRQGMAIMYDKARLYNPASTMEELANQIQGQMRTPVMDATGLQGKYEVNLYWSAAGMRSAPPPAPGGAAVPMASTPDGDSGPTLLQALQDQLGLRLEAKKGPVDFLVVDHMEKSPGEN